MLNQNQAQFGGAFQPPAQRPKGCLGRNWKWMVPAGCLGLILAAVALVGAIFFAAMSALKSSDVYQGALNAARAHPTTAERLGEPVKDGWLVKGNVKFDGAGGRADFEIPVSGPKNSGTLYVRAVRPDDAWMFERLDLAVAGAETTSLLDRNVVQPTPVTPEEMGHPETLAKQLALYVTMYSPLQMAADLPEINVPNDLIDALKHDADAGAAPRA